MRNAQGFMIVDEPLILAVKNERSGRWEVKYERRGGLIADDGYIPIGCDKAIPFNQRFPNMRNAQAFCDSQNQHPR